MSGAMARSRHGLLLDLIGLRRELRFRIEKRKVAGKNTAHLLPHLRRVDGAIANGEFLEIN